MTLRAYPFDNITTTEVDVSKLFREFQDSGIAASPDAQDFSVYATGSDGMQVFVRAGFALINGYALDSSAVEPKGIGAASTSQRQDLVVLRCDPGNNSITPEVLPGTPGGGIPIPTWTDTDICELPLAVVTVRANVTAIDASDVVDARKFISHAPGLWRDGAQPSAPRIGDLGYNLTTQRWEFWNGSTWSQVVPSDLDVSTVHAGSITLGTDNKKVVGTTSWGDPAAAFSAAPEGISVLGGVTLFGQTGTLTTTKVGSYGKQEFVASEGWQNTRNGYVCAWRSVDATTGNWGQWQKLSYFATNNALCSSFTVTGNQRNSDGTTYGIQDVSFPTGWFTADGDPHIFLQVQSAFASAMRASATCYGVTNSGCTVRVDFPLKNTSAVTVHIMAAKWSNGLA